MGFEGWSGVWFDFRIGTKIVSTISREDESEGGQAQGIFKAGLWAEWPVPERQNPLGCAQSAETVRETENRAEKRKTASKKALCWNLFWRQRNFAFLQFL